MGQLWDLKRDGTPLAKVWRERQSSIEVCRDLASRSSFILYYCDTLNPLEAGKLLSHSDGMACPRRDLLAFAVVDPSAVIDGPLASLTKQASGDG